MGDGTVLIHGGPQSVSLVPQVPYLAPSGRVVPPRRAFTIPPPSALLRQEQVLFKDAPETAAEEEDKGQVAGCVVEVWGGLTHAPSLSVCLSVSSECLPRR